MNFSVVVVVVNVLAFFSAVLCSNPVLFLEKDDKEAGVGQCFKTFRISRFLRWKLQLIS